MHTARKLVSIGIDEFIAWEDRQAEKHELVGGEIFAMVGGAIGHSVVAGNLIAALRSKLKRPCRPFGSDVRVKVEQSGSVYYPDVVVSCAEQDMRSTVLRDPSLVVEVLSPSTAAFDRRKKRADYATIPTMRYVLLVDPEERMVELDRRDPDGGWTRETFTGEGTVDLPDFSASLTLDEILAE